MATERSIGNGGYTLIEIVVAMVILAIGLLGLEALGIRAARSITLADRQSGYATLASDSLESALLQLRRDTNEIPTQFCRTDLKFGDRLSREVVRVNNTNDRLVEVTVRVIPNPQSVNAPRDTFVVSSSVYRANEAAAPNGQPCT